MVFLADILFCFNTSYYEEGQLITSRKKIAKKYLKFEFWFDVVTSFALITNPLELHSFVQVIFLLRLYKMNDNARDVAERF